MNGDDFFRPGGRMRHRAARSQKGPGTFSLFILASAWYNSLNKRGSAGRTARPKNRARPGGPFGKDAEL